MATRTRLSLAVLALATVACGSSANDPASQMQMQAGGRDGGAASAGGLESGSSAPDGDGALADDAPAGTDDAEATGTAISASAPTDCWSTTEASKRRSRAASAVYLAVLARSNPMSSCESGTLTARYDTWLSNATSRTSWPFALISVRIRESVGMDPQLITLSPSG